MKLVLSGPKIYTEDGMLTGAKILLQDGLIHAIEEDEKKISADETFSFPETFHLVPGFIDVHVHGANGHDVMDANAEGLLQMSQALVSEGTTSFLATTMTAEIQQIEAALSVVHQFMQQESGANILGVHLEGPFLSAEKNGAQRVDQMISPNIKLMQHWQKLSGDAIKLVTLAPEKKDSLALINYLRQENIIAAIGHTNANFDEAMLAVNAGCTHATHLFNAMRGIHQRDPGTVTAALLSDEVRTELIVDGKHLHPAIVKLVVRQKGVDGIILVTDAMRAKCLGEGCFELGGQSVEVKDGLAKLADGTLAGSVLPMNSAIRNVVEFAGCGVEDAVKMAAGNPAKSLGIYDKKGSIALGKDADLVVLDDQLDVVLTVSRGLVIFKK